MSLGSSPLTHLSHEATVCHEATADSLVIEVWGCFQKQSLLESTQNSQQSPEWPALLPSAPYIHLLEVNHMTAVRQLIDSQRRPVRKVEVLEWHLHCKPRLKPETQRNSKMI